MARALIVGCGCHGRALGEALLADGWQVRGTSRTDAGAGAIGAAGIEAVIADPAAIGTVFEWVEGVAIVWWLLGSAKGDAGQVAAINGERLETLFEKLVDTPVRGLVYEGAGTAAAEHLQTGARIARDASQRWRIPVQVVTTGRDDATAWRREMLAAGERALLER